MATAGFVSQLRTARWRLARIIPFARPYRKHFFILLATLTLISGLGAVSPIIIGRVVDVLTSRRLGELLFLVSVQLVISLTQGALSYLHGKNSILFSEQLARDIRTTVAENLRHSKIEQIVLRPLGEITNRIDGDVEAVIGAILNVLPTFESAVNVLLMLVIMPFVNWRLSLISLIFVPAWFFLSFSSAPRFSKLREELSRRRDGLDTIITEDLSVGGIVRAKITACYDLAHERLHGQLNKVIEARLALNSISCRLNLSQTALSSIAPAAVLLFGGFLVARGEATVGSLVTFLGLLGRVYGPIAAIAGIQTQVLALGGIFSRIIEFLDITLERHGEMKPRSYDVEIDNVSFGFGERTILSGISVTIAEGERLLIMGPSGCGKTTLSRLIVGLYRPTSGEIRVGGLPLNTLDINDYRRNIGYVSQDHVLFTGTLRENLTYGLGVCPDRQIWDILATCELDSVVQSWPSGLDSIISSQGSALSGGQRQRIALARALLGGPRVLILDEATSSVDPKMESRIVGYILQRFPKATIVVISHRPSNLLSDGSDYTTLDLGSVAEYAYS